MNYIRKTNANKMREFSLIFCIKKPRNTFNLQENTMGLFDFIKINQTLGDVYRVKPLFSNNFHCHL